MTDREFINSVDKMTTEKLIETLEDIGCDGYYRDIWSATLGELKHRIEKAEQEPKTDEPIGNSKQLDCISKEQSKAEIRKAFPSLADRVDINSILNGLPSVNQD